MEQVERAYAASEIWQGEQIRRENESGVRMPDDEYIANVADIYGQSLGLDQHFCGELIETFTQRHESTYSLAPCAIDVLEGLSKRHIPLGIVSNNYPGIRDVLEEQGISEFFEPIIISEEVKLYKPDPEILRLACDRAGTTPEGCVYVGDHPFDILCAHEAGIAAVWTPLNRFMKVPEYIGAPEHTISYLGELLDII